MQNNNQWSTSIIQPLYLKMLLYFKFSNYLEIAVRSVKW